MRNFRSASLGLLLGCSGLFSQPLTCDVSTTAANFRVASVADLIGDVIFRCLPGPQPLTGQSYVSGDLKIALNTNLSNRTGAGGDPSTTDAVLVINENHAAPVKDSTLGGPAKNVPIPQFGRLVAPNVLQWSGVKIPIPGGVAPDGTPFLSRTTLRITNLRVNPSLLGFSSSFGPVQIALASAGIADAAQIRGVDGTQLLGGGIKQGLIVAETPVTLCSDKSLNIVNGAVSGPPSFTVRITEGFEYAFRPLGSPTTDPGIPPGESGYPTPGLGANGGGADQGTRLMLRFNSVGIGVRVAVPTKITQGSLTIQLLQGVDAAGSGKFNPVTSPGLRELPASAGTVAAVYEVTASDNTQIESIDIPVTVGYTANPAQNIPPPGTTTVNVSFAPLTAFPLPSPSAPLPRFSDDSVARNAFTVADFCPPVPTITRLVPNSVPACGGKDLILGVAGSGFGFSSTVEFNGVPILNTVPTSLDFTGLYATIPGKMLTTPGTVQVDVTNNGAARSNSLPFMITPLQPAIAAGGLVNAASFTGKVARGSLATIFGSSFTCTSGAASMLPLPPTLAGVSVTVGGVPSPLVFAAGSQINFQIPYEVPPGSAANVVVTNNGVQSSPMSVALGDYAVGVFTYARTPQTLDPVIVHYSTNAVVTPSNPAVPNEFLVIYATGIGKLSNPPRSGAAVSGISAALDTPVITIGSTPLAVTFAGMTPGLAGLAQFNVQMPANLANGSLPLVIKFPGDASAPVNLAVSGSASNPNSVEITDVVPHTPVNSDNLHFEYVVHSPHSFTGTLTHFLYFSKNSQITTSDQVLASGDGTKSFDDEKWTYSGISFPSSAAGRYYVAVGVTVKGDQDPSHIAISQSFPIDVIAQHPPFDLSVTLTKIVPTSAAAGSPITVSYSVQEPTGISGTFSRSIYIGTQSSITTGDTLINTRTFDLVRGQFSLDSTNNVIPANLKPGNYWVAVIVQTDGDSNPSNNTSTALPITVTAPAAAGASATDPPPVQSEEEPARLRPTSSQEKAEK